MEKAFKIISKTLSTIIVSLVVILAILLAGVRLIGLTPYTVLSGSMEPTYHVGSIIYVKKVDPSELKLKDPVTFRLSGNVIATHRIIEIHGKGTSELSFRTKGDANKTEDGIIPASAIIGKPVFSVPLLGFVSNFVQQPQGLICVIGGGAILLLISYLVEGLLSKEKTNKKEENIG